MHGNIDVHSRRLIVEFPGYGMKCIEKLQSHCANMNFSEKVGMIEPSSGKIYEIRWWDLEIIPEDSGKQFKTCAVHLMLAAPEHQ